MCTKYDRVYKFPHCALMLLPESFLEHSYADPMMLSLNAVLEMLSVSICQMLYEH
jgi:hypothetical protein